MHTHTHTHTYTYNYTSGVLEHKYRVSLPSYVT